MKSALAKPRPLVYNNFNIMRLFLAFKLPQTAVSYLEKIQAQLKPYTKKGSFVPPNNFHLTLKFLGEVYPDKLYSLYGLLDDVKEYACPTFSIQQISTLRAADIVCAKLKYDEGAAKIEKHMTDMLEKVGFTVEKRAYVPHVTLMRRYAFDLPFSEIVKNITVYNKPFCCDEIKLYSSLLSNGSAPLYSELYSVKLKEEE